MKVRKNGTGVRVTAESKRDSLNLLKFLEKMGGKENDPNRQSLKKERELDIEDLDELRTEWAKLLDESIFDDFETRANALKEKVLEIFQRQPDLATKSQYILFQIDYVTCGCGKVTPTETATINEDAVWSCPECQEDYRKEVQNA